RTFFLEVRCEHARKREQSWQFLDRLPRPFHRQTRLFQWRRSVRDFLQRVPAHPQALQSIGLHVASNQVLLPAAGHERETVSYQDWRPGCAPHEVDAWAEAYLYLVVVVVVSRSAIC